MPLRVEVDLADLERTQKGSIVGRLWLVLDEYAFPERGWSDLIVVVLGWWSDQLLQAGSAEETMTLQFMDGPYSVRMQAPSEGEMWSVYLLRDRAPLGSKREVAGVADRTQFAADVLAAVHEVVDACRSKGWADDQEVLKLGRLADSLAARRL